MESQDNQMINENQKEPFFESLSQINEESREESLIISKREDGSQNIKNINAQILSQMIKDRESFRDGYIKITRSKSEINITNTRQNLQYEKLNYVEL